MNSFNFEKGLLVTGKYDAHESYAVTNNTALLVVTGVFATEIKVFIASSPNTERIGLSFTVLKDQFIPISLNEWKKSHPDCTLTIDTILSMLSISYSDITNIIELEGYVKEPPKEINTTEGMAEISDIYVLSDEDRQILLKEMTELLETYGYKPTEKALNIILDEWVKNKGYLINLISKHPNYNGKFQIAFSKDYDRKIDKHLASMFGNFLSDDNVRQLVYPKPVKLGCYTFKEVRASLDRLQQALSWFNVEGVHTINNRTRKSYEIEYDFFMKLKRKMLEISDGKTYDGIPVTKESYNKFQLYGDVRSYIRNGYSQQFVDSNFAETVSYHMPELKIVKGQKMSKAVNKIMTALGIHKHPNYNREFAKYSDAINPLKIKRHTVLSVHPIDYLTMSFGNSWASCHTIDKKNKRKMPNSYSGCYSSGTMSYMLDKVSMIFYTVDAKASEDNLELEDKINRNMFHYDKAKLIQGRIYPQDCDSGCNDMYEDFRNVVQKIVADCLEVENLWNISKGYSACADITRSYGTHYRDYTNYSNCNVSTLKLFKSFDNKTKIDIGHDPICPSCGKSHRIAENIECGKSGCKTNRQFFYCAYHDRDEEGVPFYTDSDDAAYCRDAIEESDNFTFCNDCGCVIDFDNHIYYRVSEGNYLCDECHSSHTLAEAS